MRKRVRVAKLPGRRDDPQPEKAWHASTVGPGHRSASYAPSIFILYGQIPSGKNAVMITRSGQRYPGKRFKLWRDEAMKQLPEIQPFTGPVRMDVEYTPGDNRRRDVPGILDALCHLIEKSGIVLDDAQVRNVSWLTLPVGAPQCRVEIQALEVMNA